MPITITIFIHNHQKVIFCLLLAYRMYVGKPSHTFAKRLCTLLKNKFNVHLNMYYQTTIVSN